MSEYCSKCSCLWDNCGCPPDTIVRESVTCPPTWKAAMHIYVAVLDNPDAPEKVKQGAREEMVKCGSELDRAQAYIKEQVNVSSKG